MSNLVSVSDYREEAQKQLSDSIFTCIDNGATFEVTKRQNKLAIQRWVIRPRVLMRKKESTTKTTFLGMRFSAPIGIAPIGFLKVLHQGGELATFRAAHDECIPYCLSVNSTYSLKALTGAVSSPPSNLFLQIDAFKDRNKTLQLIRIAEEAGCIGLTLGVDFPFRGVRYQADKTPLRTSDSIRLFIKEELFGAGIKDPHVEIDPYFSWEFVGWIKRNTTLPLVVKGILTAEDALIAVESGADAIWISNHGGTQLDGVIPSIDALPEVVKAVGGRCQICVDGGFETGSDIFKALALGADMVFLGRPFVWALASSGEEGVKNFAKQMKKELEFAFGLTGCSTINDIQHNMVAPIKCCHCS